MSYEDDREEGFGKSLSHGKPSRDDSPNFDSTKLVAEDGRLLGMKVSKELAGQINTFYPALLTYLSEWGEKIVGPAAERLAKQMGKSELEVARIGSHARDMTGYGIIFAKPGIEMLTNVWEAGRNTTELARALKPLGKEGWECETVQTVKNRTRNIFLKNLTHSATGIVGSVPALYSKVSKQSLLVEEREKQARWKAAQKDPEKLAALLEEEASLKSGLANPAQERQAMEIVLDKHEKAYRLEFYGDKETQAKGFVHSDKANEIRKRVKDDLGKLPDKYDEFHEWSKLNRYGINSNTERGRIENAPVSAQERPDRNNYPIRTRQQVWEDFKKRFQSKELKRIQEDEVKTFFARQKGAVLEYGWVSNNSDKLPTIREQRSKIFEEHMKQARDGEKAAKGGDGHGHGAKGEKETNHIATLAAGLGAGLASEWLGNVIGLEKDKKKFVEPTAWDYIDALKKIQRKALDSGENLPETVPLDEKLAGSLRDAVRARGEGTPRSEISYALIIHEIIQRNESERGRPPVHKHEFEHLENAGWDDKKIQDIPDSELTAYEVAVTRMAKLVETGQLSAIALNLLVGHRKYKITTVLQNGGEEESQKTAIMGKIDAVMQNYRLRDDVDEEKATQARGGIVITDEAIKAGFGAGGMKGDQRAFTYALLEAVVQNKKELCKITGMNDQQCKTLGAECGPRFNQLLDAAVLEMAEAIRSNPEALEKQIKLTDDERKMIVGIAERVEEHGKDVADAAENREQLKAAETAVANALMTAKEAADGKEQGFWQRMVERMRHPKPKPEEIKSKSQPDRHDDDGYEEKPKFARRVREESKDDPWMEESKPAMQKKGSKGREDLGYDEENEISGPGEVDKPKDRFAERVRGDDGASLASAKHRSRSGKKNGSDSYTPGGALL